MAKTKQPDRGILWEITKNGRRSYLYGTVHVAKLEWDVPGPTILMALNASKEVAVELDSTDPNLTKRMNAPMNSTAFTPISEDVANSLAIRVSDQFRRACIDEKNFEDATLGSKVLSLTLLSARDVGLSPEFGIDASLIGYARYMGKTITELETVNEQKSALFVGGLKMLESEISRLENGGAREQLIRLTTDWANGNFEDIKHYLSWCNCVDDMESMKRLLDDRNVVLAERIARLYEKRDDVFVAIGVLHLISSGNVIERLQHSGYTVRQLTALEQP